MSTQCIVLCSGLFFSIFAFFGGMVFEKVLARSEQRKVGRIELAEANGLQLLEGLSYHDLKDFQGESIFIMKRNIKRL